MALRESALASGFGDPKVTLVDPACGPGGFLAAARAVDEAEGTPARVLGLDRDADVLEVAKQVLGPAFDDWPLELQAGDTLASLPSDPGDVVVVLGNPPWAGRSESRAELSETLLDDFRRDGDGQPLGERKIGVLSDAYVRFWRWAAEAVRRARIGGVVGFVTNGSFLDGPVHRGMRAALSRWFDRIDVVDLGGSALVAQAERDENVFGVRPSVAITIAVRGPAHDETRAGTVRVMALRGQRDAKLRALAGVPAFRSIPRGGPWRLAPAGSVREWPEGWRSVAELFPFHREGVQTNRDAIAIAKDRATLASRVQSFGLGLHRPDLEGAWERRRHFDPERARAAIVAALRDDPEMKAMLRPIAYRPWDERCMVAVSPLCHRPRPALRQAMEHSSFALLTVRKDRGERPWTHFGISRAIPDNCYLSARSSCRTRAFPTHDEEGRANLSEAAKDWDDDPERLLLHTFAILASVTYRTRFGWLLRQDYPVVPPPSEATIAAGRALAERWLGGGPRSEKAVVGHWTVDAPEGLSAALEQCETAASTLLEE